jgi:hypothetical protein
MVNPVQKQRFGQPYRASLRAVAGRVNHAASEQRLDRSLRAHGGCKAWRGFHTKLNLVLQFFEAAPDQTNGCNDSFSHTFRQAQTETPLHQRQGSHCQTIWRAHWSQTTFRRDELDFGAPLGSSEAAAGQPTSDSPAAQARSGLRHMCPCLPRSMRCRAGRAVSTSF